MLLPVFAVFVRGGPCAGGVFTSPTSSRQERGNEMSAVRRVVKKANDCRRFKAKISYNGELFSGWQKQGAQNGRSFRTVEETLETCIGSALAQVLSAFCLSAVCCFVNYCNNTLSCVLRLPCFRASGSSLLVAPMLECQLQANASHLTPCSHPLHLWAPSLRRLFVATRLR